MIRTLHAAYACLALVVLFAAPMSFAATVTPQEGRQSFPVTTTNNLLLNNLSSAVYSGLSGEEGYAIPDTNNTVLIDGQFGSERPADGKATVASLHNDFVATFTLNTATNTNGYTITRIEVFGGWNDSGRDRQRYDVAYRPVGGSAFIPFASVNFEPNGFAPNPSTPYWNTFVTLTDLGLDFKAVDALRFTFPTQELDYAGYREISVFGVPAPPSASAPVITPAADGFTTPTTTVTITNTQVGGTTYYTLDGSLPTSAPPTPSLSTTSSVNFDLSAATTVRALTEAPGLLSNEVTRNFLPVCAAETVTNDTAAGVRGRMYLVVGNGGTLPDFTTGPVVFQKLLASPFIADSGDPHTTNPFNTAQRTNYSAQFDGYINVPTDGLYTFYTASDDGSRLFIGSTLVVENNASQGVTEKNGTIALQAGKHPILVQYGQGGGGAALTTRYAGPGIAKTQIPDSAFTTVPVASDPVISIGGGSTFTGQATVTITSSSGAPSVIPTIYYTLDGSDPTIDSYAGTFPSGGTFQITQNTTVRALAYLPPATGISSAITSASFTRTAAPTDAPKLLYAKSVGTNAVDVVFDIAMGASASVAANYAIPGLTISNAVLDADTKTVHLTTTLALNPTTTYTLTVSNVQSAPGTSIGSPKSTSFRASPNGVTFERFYDASVAGGTMAELKALAAFNNNTPTNTNILTTLEFPDGQYGDHYGSRLRTYFLASASGEYGFRIASDDQSELYISTDATAANKVPVAGCLGATGFRNFGAFPEDTPTGVDTTPLNDQFGRVTLTAGQLYYIEVLHAEGGGNDFMTVQYALPVTAGQNFAYDFIPNSNLFAFSTPALVVNVPGAGALRERYDGIPGNQVALLTTNSKYPAAPDVVDFVTAAFESPQTNPNVEAYGLRLSAFYKPPQSGDFRFYISGDDDCQLWLSTDENPANAVLICNKVGGGTGTRDWPVGSGKITLDSSKSYYMYALVKEGGGGDHVAVTTVPDVTPFVPPNGASLPIDGANITPAVFPLSISSQSANKRVRYGTSTTLNVVGIGGLGRKTFKWFRNGVEITGETNSTLALNNVTGTATATYTVQMSGTSDGYTQSILTSDPMPVQVYADITLDTATLAQTFDSTPRTVTATTAPGALPYSVTYAGSTTVPVDAGTYAIVASATGGVEAVANGSLVVSPVTGATVALAPQTVAIPYDRNPHGLTFTTVPPTLNVVVTYNDGVSPATTTQPTNAGTYTVVATINSPNAVGTPTDTDTLIISKLDLTLAADAKTRVYGDTSALGLTFNGTGFVGPETIAVLTGTPTLTTTAVAANAGTPDPGSDVGSYAITLDQGSLAATNYNFLAFNDSTYAVTPRPLDLSATSIQLEYGVPTPSVLSFTVDTASLAPGDVQADALTGTGSPVVTSTRQTLSSVGTYPITLLPGTLGFTNNYMLGATTGGTITVVPTTTASLVVPATTVTYTGAPQGVVPVTTPGALTTTITYNGSATVPTNAGTYAVVATINDADSAVSPSANGTLTINKATAVISFFNLFQTENGTPRPVSVVTSPANLAVNVTYNGSTTAPTLPGTYAVVATINETNYQGTANATLRVGGPPPLITSPLTATPNPVQVGKTVTFSIAATHPLNLPLTITYDYGDGTSDTTGVHVYTFPQVATVMASVSDGISTITSTIQVLVVSAASPEGDLDGDGINNSIDTDDDGDGLSDIFEDAIGSSPLDAGNLPLDDPNQAKNPGPLDVKKMAIKLSFSKTLADSISISGTLPVKAGFVGANKKFVVDVGGVIKSYTLGAKNSVKVGSDYIKLTVKAKKGVVSADQAAKYSIKISKGTFASTLADDGLGNENAKNKPTTVRVDLLFNGQYLRKLVPQIYSAKQGSSGRTK